MTDKVLFLTIISQWWGMSNKYKFLLILQFKMIIMHMHTEKLLSVLKDLQIDEEEKEIQSLLTQLNEAVSSNNAELIASRKTEVIDALTETRSFNFIPSEVSILKKIDGELFYGVLATHEFISYFNFDLYLLKENLEAYRVKRKEFVTRVNQLVTSLEGSNFKPHYQDDLYEIGIILPDKYKQLSDVSGAISKWNKFLNTLSDVIGEEKKNEISLVSQGSIEFYILATLPLAKAINLILDQIVEMHKKVIFIKEEQEKLKILKNETILSELEVEKKSIHNKFVDEVTTEVLKHIKFKDEGERNQSTASLKGQMNIIFKLHQDGVTLEIKAPEYTSEVDETLSEKEKKAIEAEVKIREAISADINKTNQKVLGTEFEDLTHLIEAPVNKEDVAEEV